MSPDEWEAQARARNQRANTLAAVGAFLLFLVGSPLAMLLSLWLDAAYLRVLLGLIGAGP